MNQALVLDDATIWREVAMDNFEVLVVLGFALNPSLFFEHVEALPDPDYEDRLIYRVRASGRLYVLYFRDVARLAFGFMGRTGVRPEILDAVFQGEGPIPRT